MGRPITDIKLPIRFPDLRQLLVDVTESMQPQHRQVEDEEGHWYTLWVRPYKTGDNKIDGAVITFMDINDVKEVQHRLENLLVYTRGILDTTFAPLLVLDAQLRIKTANAAFYKIFSTDAARTEGKLVYELDNDQWGLPHLRSTLEKSVTERQPFQDLEVTFDIPGGVSRVML